jgi:hypothetical protein
MNLLGQKFCKACLLLDGKNRGLLKLGIIGRTKVPDPIFTGIIRKTSTIMECLHRIVGIV